MSGTSSGAGLWTEGKGGGKQTTSIRLSLCFLNVRAWPAAAPHTTVPPPPPRTEPQPAVGRNKPYVVFVVATRKATNAAGRNQPEEEFARKKLKTDSSNSQTK